MSWKHHEVYFAFKIVCGSSFPTDPKFKASCEVRAVARIVFYAWCCALDVDPPHTRLAPEVVSACYAEVVSMSPWRDWPVCAMVEWWPLCAMVESWPVCAMAGWWPVCAMERWLV